MLSGKYPSEVAAELEARIMPVGTYIVDFLCAESRIVVEIDGLIHEHQGEYDAERDDYLAQLGYRVIRVPAEQVSRNLPSVLDLIRTSCQTPPLPRAGEGAGGEGCSP